jgi:DNA (cytosine-5)-methyltransferase 1
MMGWPAGWTAGRGLDNNARLKLCGNGVVPQQAIVAYRLLLPRLGQQQWGVEECTAC